MAYHSDVTVVVFKYLFYVNECFASTTHMLSAHRGQERELDPPEMELKMIVSGHVGAENGIQVRCKSNKCP